MRMVRRIISVTLYHCIIKKDDISNIVPLYRCPTDCPRHSGGETVPADALQDRPHTEGVRLPAGPDQETQ